MGPISVRAATTTPAASAGLRVVLSPADFGLPRYYGGSATALAFSRPAQCSLRAAARTVADSPTGALLFECFSSFVTS